MSDPKKPEPDEDLLEFLGGIDEVNEDSQGGDFSDFLANTDIDKVVNKPPASKTTPPVKEGSRE
jgi:hypothetical protein